MVDYIWLKTEIGPSDAGRYPDQAAQVRLNCITDVSACEHKCILINNLQKICVPVADDAMSGSKCAWKSVSVHWRMLSGTV